MEIESLGQVVAEQRLVLSTGKDQNREVIIRLGMPRPFGDRGDQYCPWEIVGLGPAKIRYAAGADAFQALRLALRMIGTDLHSYRRRYGRGFYLLEEGDDLGFPEEAWTTGLGHLIVCAFGPVYGLGMSAPRKLGNITAFDFGTPGTAEYTLHIQCPWRLVGAEGIVADGFDSATVQQVEADDYGGVDVQLTGGYRLQLFPNSASGEDWRLFSPQATHIVIEAGRLSEREA